jgi:two-component system cell cycle sensor histidine kinase/response regulator CckA
MIFITMFDPSILPYIIGLCVILGAAIFTAIRLYHRHYRDRAVLNEIFEGSNSARLVTDIRDKTLFYNPAFEDLCDEGEKPSLKTLQSIFLNNQIDKHVEDRLGSLVENARRGHEDILEAQTYSNSGEVRWYRLSAQPVAGWLGTVHWRLDNVTDRLAVEVVVKEEREKLVDFTDHAPVGFYAINEEGRFTFVNATLARWLGNDIDSLLNNGFLRSYLVHPPQSECPYDIIEDGGARQVAETQIKGPAGRVFDAAINQSVVIEGDGVVRVRGVIHDLTSERQMRRALKDSEDRFKSFFEEAPLGIAILDNDQKIINSNARLSEFLNVDIANIEGQNFLSFVTEKDTVKVQDLFDDICSSDTTTNLISIDLLSHSEEDIPVQVYASSLTGDNIAVRIFDRSEQKTLEEQVTQSQKMQAVGQLAGGIAHDFNNLLTAMIGFCDLLLLRHKAGDPSFNDIMQIKQNSNRAANLVRQLLAFSRQQKLNSKQLDITEILTELSHLIRRLIGVQIDFDLQHGSDLYNVKADAGQLEQVFINLAVNARDAMDGKGNLTIETENVITKSARKIMNDKMPAGEWVVIHVRDTGSGIDQDTLDRIFEPFFTTKKIGEGTGLGLATVYGIIRQTGGYINVDSTVGKGSCFSVYLPQFEGSGADLLESTENAVTDTQDHDLTGAATILLVEDEDAVRMFSARALSNKGYDVLEADCGESALEVIKNHEGTIDLIVTDVIMPEMDGPTMAKEVLKQYPSMPIIFVSGYTEDRFEGELGENACFLPKPFTLQQLAVKVKDVLAK